jgi:hypothetical protein
MGSYLGSSCLYYCIVRCFHHYLQSNGSVLAPGLPNVHEIHLPESTFGTHNQRIIDSIKYYNGHLQPDYTWHSCNEATFDKTTADRGYGYSWCWVDVSFVFVFLQSVV